MSEHRLYATFNMLFHRSLKFEPLNSILEKLWAKKGDLQFFFFQRNVWHIRRIFHVNISAPVNWLHLTRFEFSCGTFSVIRRFIMGRKYCQAWWGIQFFYRKFRPVNAIHVYWHIFRCILTGIASYHKVFRLSQNINVE